MLVVEFMVAIVLQPNVFDWVILEFLKFTLGQFEHRKGNLSKNIVDVWLNHGTRLLEFETKRDKLDAESKAFSTHELASA